MPYSAARFRKSIFTLRGARFGDCRRCAADFHIVLLDAIVQLDAGAERSILTVGTCMVAAAAQTGWQGPRWMIPIFRLGQRSYEVYLTHMFVLFALLALLVEAGKPMRAVPLFFAAAILLSGRLGAAVARFYSEPMNRRLRKRFGDGAERLGSVVEASQLAGSSR
jgi:peptidoglycan/LPS O-acetylase OafA/YrhL